jgi:uncharacterized protein YkwD
MHFTLPTLLALSCTLGALATPLVVRRGPSQSDINAYLKGHNDLRKQHGAAPLAWDNKLSAAAEKWASGCAFHHSGGSLGPFGENLAAGTVSGLVFLSLSKSGTFARAKITAFRKLSRAGRRKHVRSCTKRSWHSSYKLL